MKWNKAFGVLMVLILTGGFISAASADEFDGQEDGSFLKTGRAYIGAVGISSTIDQWGDFQGIHAVSSASSGGSTATNSEVDIIPSITRTFGWGALVGYREGAWGGEVSFWRSDHTATYYTTDPNTGNSVTNTTPASLSSVNVDFKRYFLTRLPVQPFASVGFSLPWLWVRQGSFLLDPSGNELANGDETISGFGFNLGAGIEVYLDQNISLVGGVEQRWTSFNQVNGVSKIPFNQLYFDGNPNDTGGGLEGDGLQIYFGSTFAFEL